MAVDTGHGFAITLATTVTTGWLFTTADMGTETLPDVDTSHLNTVTYRTYKPGDLVEGGVINFVLQTDPLIDAPVTGTVELLTGTPAKSVPGSAAAGTWTMTGYINSVKRPSYNLDELQLYEIGFKVDGGATDPTWTKEL